MARNGSSIAQTRRKEGHSTVTSLCGLGTMIALSAVSVLIMTAPVWSYDLQTHQRLSRAAVARSAVSSLLEQTYAVLPAAELRGPLPWLGWTTLSPTEWVTKGAQDEDTWTRPANHFYDPVHDIPLSRGRLAIGERAPDWALEDRQEYSIQQYSYRDARQAFYAALSEPDKTTRERSGRCTFYSLGHVIHVIQDMAQPQHTRNDSHFFLGPNRSLSGGLPRGARNRRKLPILGGSMPQIAPPGIYGSPAPAPVSPSSATPTLSRPGRTSSN